jgi:hypothetical protein
MGDRKGTRLDPLTPLQDPMALGSLVLLHNVFPTFDFTLDNPFHDSGVRVTKDFGMCSKLTNPEFLKWSDVSN